MKAGYVKTYRKLLNSDIWKMPPIYERVFKYLNLKAKYKLEEFPTRNGYSIYLLPGQLITSMSAISEGVSWTEWGVEKVPNKKIIKDVLEWLEGNSMVTVISNRHGTFIEIVNWRFYHGFDEEKVTQNNGNEVTNWKRLVDTIKEVKELKELKELNKYINNILRQNSQKVAKTYSSDSKEIRLVDYFISRIRINKSDFREPNKQTWAKTFDLMLRKDKLRAKEIASMIKWVQEDDFEMTNVLSPDKLRSRWDQLGLKKNKRKSNEPEIVKGGYL